MGAACSVQAAAAAQDKPRRPTIVPSQWSEQDIFLRDIWSGEDVYESPVRSLDRKELIMPTQASCRPPLGSS